MTDLLVAAGVAGLSDVERKRHLTTIERLAEASGVPKGEIGRLYQTELERAMPARIRDFLPILIGRKVKQDLLSRHAG